MFVAYGIIAHCNNWASAQQNQQNGMCVQQRLRSALVFAQSDQSLCRPHEESLGPLLHIERKRRLWSDWADAQADLSLRWAHMLFYWFCRMHAYISPNREISGQSVIWACPIRIWQMGSFHMLLTIRFRMSMHFWSYNTVYKIFKLTLYNFIYILYCHHFSRFAPFLNFYFYLFCYICFNKIIRITFLPDFESFEPSREKNGPSYAERLRSVCACARSYSGLNRSLICPPFSLVLHHILFDVFVNCLYFTCIYLYFTSICLFFIFYLYCLLFIIHLTFDHCFCPVQARGPNNMFSGTG